MNQSPEVSFIVVNYNGIKDTRELLISIVDFVQYLSYEVIVVDNGSVINEGALLIIEFPKFKILRSEKNLGFSGGNNLGIKASIGNYLMFINNDTLLTDCSICELVKILKNDSSIGAVSPKIHFFHPTNTIQFAGFTELTKITLRNRTIGNNELDSGQYDTSASTASTHGAAMMVKREVIEKIGYMPEIYFLYYEEHDWCANMRRNGYRLAYQPEALVIHKDSQSTGSDSYLKRYYLTRNRLLFAYRNRRGIIRILAIVYQLVIANPKLVLLSLLKRRKDLALASFKGVIDFFCLKNKSSN